MFQIVLSIFLIAQCLCQVQWIGDFAQYSTWSKTTGYGSNLRSFVPDPKASGQTALKVSIVKGTILSAGGTGFYIYPFTKVNNASTGIQAATFEYDVLFSSDFPWVKGGKLPGMFGGRSGCSGGDLSSDCYSARFMWSSNGDGYPYLYLPPANHLAEFCNYTQYKDCARDFGFAFNKTAYFTKDKWLRVKEYLKLNTPNVANGVLKVWIDGKLKTDYSKIIWRTSSSVHIAGIQFEMFFGGSTLDWAPPNNCSALFKNLKFSY